jgi:hypothetical protein
MMAESDVSAFYRQFLAMKDYGFLLRKDGKIAVVVPEEMPEEEFGPIADYVEGHADELRQIIKETLLFPACPAPAPASGQGQPEIQGNERPAPAPACEQGQGQTPVRAMDVRVGVITDEHLYHMRRGKLAKIKLPHTPAHVGEICQLCLTHDLSALWVLPDTCTSRRAHADFLQGTRTQWGIKSYTLKRAPGHEEEGLATVGAWKLQEARAPEESGRVVYVIFPEYETDWKLDDVRDPIMLLATMAYVEDAIEAPVRFSPGNVGKEIMARVNAHWKRERWIEPTYVNRYAPVVEEKVPQLLWKRALSEQERSRAGVVAYDKNSQFPASCTSVVMGAGAPVHVEKPLFQMKERPTPGVWYCRVSGSSIFDGVQLPHPTRGKTEGWFWSYTVKLLMEVGYHVEIEQAYLWENGHTILRPFAERLWRARASLKEDMNRYRHEQARERAQDAIKLMMNVALGWLDMGKNRDLSEEEIVWYHRPDWYQLLRDNAYYQMFWRVRTYLKKGFSPIGIYEDCLYYAVDDLNHETALPGMMERVGKLGGFKRKYRYVDIPMTVAQPLFDDPQMDIQKINLAFSALDKAQKERLKEH